MKLLNYILGCVDDDDILRDKISIKLNKHKLIVFKYVKDMMEFFSLYDQKTCSEICSNKSNNTNITIMQNIINYTNDCNKIREALEDVIKEYKNEK